MTKFVFILWRPESESLEDFRNTLLSEKGPALLAQSPDSLSISIAEPGVEGIDHPREDGSVVSALVSAGVDNLADARTLAEILDPSGTYIAGYAVTEAIPLDYDKTWPDGDLTPGISQVTFLYRKQGMGYDDFLDYWHNSHTPLALEIHPLSRYVRNVVVSSMTPNAPMYEGIVELLFRTREDLVDPVRFFGEDTDNNMIRISEDIGNFINMDLIEVTTMCEYVLKSRNTGEINEQSK